MSHFEDGVAQGGGISRGYMYIAQSTEMASIGLPFLATFHLCFLLYARHCAQCTCLTFHTYKTACSAQAPNSAFNARTYLPLHAAGPACFGREKLAHVQSSSHASSRVPALQSLNICEATHIPSSFIQTVMVHQTAH